MSLIALATSMPAAPILFRSNKLPSTAFVSVAREESLATLVMLDPYAPAVPGNDILRVAQGARAVLRIGGIAHHAGCVNPERLVRSCVRNKIHLLGETAACLVTLGRHRTVGYAGFLRAEQSGLSSLKFVRC